MKMVLAMVVLAASLLTLGCNVRVPEDTAERCETLFAKYAKCKGLSPSEARVQSQVEICAEEGFFAGDEGSEVYQAFMRMNCREIQDATPVKVEELFPE